MPNQTRLGRSDHGQASASRRQPAVVPDHGRGRRRHGRDRWRRHAGGGSAKRHAALGFRSRRGDRRRRRRRPARRDHSARQRRLGDRGRRELRHRRPRHAERRAHPARRRPRAAAEARHQGYGRAGIQRLGAVRPRGKQVQRPRPDPHLRRRADRDLGLPDRERRRIHREADPVARRLDGAAHLRVQGVARRERDQRAAKKPQRLRPRAPARAQRAQEGRADFPQAQDDRHRSRQAERPPRARHHRHERQQPGEHPGAARASSSRPAATPATSTSAACSIRG